MILIVSIVAVLAERTVPFLVISSAIVGPKILLEALSLLLGHLGATGVMTIPAVSSLPASVSDEIFANNVPSGFLQLIFHGLLL